MPKSLYEVHVSFLAPEEAVITVSGSSETEVEINLRETLDQVKDLKIMSIKNLGQVPEKTDIDTSATDTVVKPTLN